MSSTRRTSGALPMLLCGVSLVSACGPHGVGPDDSASPAPRPDAGETLAALHPPPTDEPIDELPDRPEETPVPAPTLPTEPKRTPEPEPEPEPGPGPEPEPEPEPESKPDRETPPPPRILGLVDVEVLAGERVELDIGTDADVRLDVVPESLPDGATFARRDDGSRLFRWETDEDDVGETLVTFEASRTEWPASRLVESVRLRVASPPTPHFVEGVPLRTLAERHGLHIGVAAARNMFDIEDGERYRGVLTEQYDILTPENSMKMSDLRPERYRYVWDTADRMVDFAESNDMLVHGHPLLWKEQIPRWAREADRASMPDIMAEQIEAMVSRYRGRIAVWDVVNEALEEDGQLRHTLWYRGVGEGYFSKAFHLAREHDPKASLIYNDYGVGWESEKSDAMYALLKRELNAGTPIDGVGFQLHLSTTAHHDNDTFRDRMRRNFRRFAELGLDIYITELDIGTDWREDQEEQFEIQARVYAETLRICLEEPACKAFQIWGMSDRHGWRAPLKAMPLNGDFSPKPAFEAMRRVLKETPVTTGR